MNDSNVINVIFDIQNNNFFFKKRKIKTLFSSKSLKNHLKTSKEGKI